MIGLRFQPRSRLGGSKAWAVFPKLCFIYFQLLIQPTVQIRIQHRGKSWQEQKSSGASGSGNGDNEDDSGHSIMVSVIWPYGHSKPTLSDGHFPAPMGIRQDNMCVARSQTYSRCSQTCEKPLYFLLAD